MTDPGPTTVQLEIEEVLDQRLPETLRSLEGFEFWCEPYRQAADVAAIQLYGEIGAALEGERQQIKNEEGSKRLIWDLYPDDSRRLKSVGSLRSKIGRELRQRIEKGTLLDGRLSEDQVEQMIFAFPDLGRFRVIADYSHDVFRALKILLPGDGKHLLGLYPLKDKIKDYVFDLDLRNPGRGHRARQFAVAVESMERRVYIEIQLMTLLQHAWDQRNHPFYDWTREGGQLSARLRINDVALAETLHLVDEQASINWKQFLEEKQQASTPEEAS